MGGAGRQRRGRAAANVGLDIDHASFRGLARRSEGGQVIVMPCSEQRLICYTEHMSQAAKDILRRVEDWPQEDQEELVELAREIEARRSGVYRLSDDERAVIAESSADVRAGRFATDEQIAGIFKKARSSRT